MLPFLKCNQANNFIAGETTDLLLGETDTLKGESFMPIPTPPPPQPKQALQTPPRPFTDHQHTQPFLYQAQEWGACQAYLQLSM